MLSYEYFLFLKIELIVSNESVMFLSILTWFLLYYLNYLLSFETANTLLSSSKVLN